MEPAAYNPALYRISLLTTAAIFPLIFLGGLVTSHQAGLAVPDWPNSFGYNMFLFPPRYWVGGILYEHTHRLWASGVGILSLLLCAWAWKSEPRPLQRWLATAVLGMVIFQGILGGLRVVFVNLDLAMVHACVAQAFFCLAALTTVTCGRWWLTAADLSDSHEGLAGRRLVHAASLTVAVVFVQLVLGVLMRHQGAGLAIPDIPLVYHHFLPPTTPDQLQQINADRVWNLGLPPVTLAQIWLHYAHRLWALVVTFSIVMLAAHVFIFHRRRRELTSLCAILLALLAGQLVLGLATVYYRKPADVASAHVAVGALVLMTTFVLTVRAFRLFWPGESLARAGMDASALRAV
jgi:cytochrome c oxidase assembly protein subunit 15